MAEHIVEINKILAAMSEGKISGEYRCLCHDVVILCNCKMHGVILKKLSGSGEIYLKLLSDLIFKTLEPEKVCFTDYLYGYKYSTSTMNKNGVANYECFNFPEIHLINYEIEQYNEKNRNDKQ